MEVILEGIVMSVRLVQNEYPLLVDYQHHAAIKVEINGDAFRKPFYS